METRGQNSGQAGWDTYVDGLVAEHGSLANLGERLAALRGHAEDVESITRALRRLRQRGTLPGGTFVPDDVADAAAVTVPDPIPGEEGSAVTVDIDVDVHTAVPIIRAESPTNTVDLAIDGDGLGASVYKVPATRDFVLRWWTAGATPQAGMLVSGEHALLTIEPPASSSYAERVPREVIWVLDTSCSMRGAPLDLAKRAMDEALGQMDPRDSFALLSFSDSVRGPFRVPVDADERNVKHAQQVVGALDASGGTMMAPAVLAALAFPVNPARHRLICLLTDGQIANDDQVLAQIAAHPEVTFATVGIGGSPNRYLLDELAALGGGKAAYATLGEAPEDAMDTVLDAMDRPVLTDVKIDWGQWQVESAYPSRVPDLHVGTPSLVAAHMLGGSGPVTLSGRLGTGVFTQVVTPVPVADGRPIVTTWARKRVAEIHRRKLLGQIIDERPAILETGLRWHILTDYTSFVAVEDDQTELMADGGEPLGQVMTAEFLSKVPTGRSYQSAASYIAGVTGTYSMNFNYDAIDALPSAGTHSVLTLGRPLLAALDAGPTVGNTLTADASAVARTGPGAAAYDVSGEIGGPVLLDKLWLASTARFELANQAGVSATSARLALRLVAQPSTANRLTLDLDADPTYAALGATASRYGGGRGTVRWNLWRSADSGLDTWVSAAQRTVRGDERSAIEAGSSFQLSNIQLAGTHDLRVGLTGEHFVWAGTARAGDANLGSAFLEDRWKPGRVYVDARLAGGVLGGDRAHFLPSPSLGVRWDPWGNERTWLRLAGSRNWGAESLQVGVTDAAGLPARADTLRFGVDQQLLGNFVASVEGWGRLEHLAFVPAPDHVAVDDVAGAPWVDRSVWELDFELSRTFSKRWMAGVRWRQGFPTSSDAALVNDARSFWVPGFLDAYRRHGFDASASWTLPDDPWTTTVGATAAWAGEVEGPQVGWWLASRTRVELSLEQAIPFRMGELSVELSAVWAARDPDRAFLPLAILAAEPGVPNLDEQPPFSGYVGVRYGF